MSRLKKRTPPHPIASQALSRSRYVLFLAITLLIPVLLLGVVEATLRLARPHDGLPLFVEARLVAGDYLVANQSVGARWFGGIDNPPSPAAEIFASQKPERAFRVFVLGESTTAGFPYPRNATFSRLLRDVLRDVLPGDSVEVVNLGIAATNSFAILDMAKEVAEQHPDAVLIYAGHNEYYGALGATSRVRVPGGGAVVRLYLHLLRLRSALALRDAIAWVQKGGHAGDDNLEATSLMEVLARDQQVPLGSSSYNEGARQFETNLESVSRFFKQKGTRVLIASLASNLRDQPPFAAVANTEHGAAESAYANARAALARGDTTAAMSLFTRALDLDVVRFRAPSEFNQIIRRVSARTGATYVPVAEAFAAASPGGIPGFNLFLEHVHPTRSGQSLIGRVFFQSLRETGALAAADTTRLRSWDDYSRGSDLTPFDERIAFHVTRTLTSRWPFVPVARQADYRRKYLPVSFLDSLAFAVSRGSRWETAKLQLGGYYEQRKYFDSATAEYAGLARDAPLVNGPWLLMARSLGEAGRPDEAEAALRKAVAIRPTAAALAVLGTRAAQRHEIPQAISFFRQSLGLQPAQPDVLYQLSIAYGVVRDLPNARDVALRLARVAPGYPGLAGLLNALNVQ